jgi:hypothetical protein
MWIAIEWALKYWKYVAIGFAVIALVAFYNVHVHNLEVSYAASKVAAVDAAYKRGSDEARAAAAAEIESKEKEHSAAMAAVRGEYEDRIQQNDAAHAADAERLRQRAAASARRANGVLAGAGSSGPAPDGGAAGVGGLGSVPAQLGLALADALRQDDAALSACYAERDSLVGK